MCIDCILSDQHKGHDIMSIQKAADKQRSMVEEQMVYAAKIESKLAATKTDIEKHITQIRIQADANRSDLTRLYNNLRATMAARE